TLSHPDQYGLKGKTISAFTHFTWLHSQHTLLFADMQGPVEIFFDPMTHSPTEDTGLVEYGQRGIDAFISQHRCNKICEEMMLESLS
ncbi:kinase-like domain-containing protein, partial [Gautieria morchelliformis]